MLKPFKRALNELLVSVALVTYPISLLKNLLQIPSDRELCVDVRLDREYYVGVVQTVPVTVYDYYEPGQTVWKESNRNNLYIA